MESIVVSATHRRTKSDSATKLKKDKDPLFKSFHRFITGMETEVLTDIKRTPSNIEVQSSLKQEIQQLEKHLKGQTDVRQALEKALGYKSFATCSSNEMSTMPKATKELIREIAMLELDVMYLEQHLLSLYRRAFEQQIFSKSPSGVEEGQISPLVSYSEPFAKAPTLDVSKRRVNSVVHSSHIVLPRKSATDLTNHSCSFLHQEKNSHGVHRSHSSLVPHSASSVDNLARALGPCHAEPRSFLQNGHNVSQSIISLADHLGTTVSDLVPETPNKLSEDMVQCMCAIYAKLANSFQENQVSSASPASSISSRSTFSPRYIADLWSPKPKRASLLDGSTKYSSGLEGIKDFSGPYSDMLEVSSIGKTSQRSRDFKEMLLKYESLVHRLEKLDPSKLLEEEKLAFWINVHNAMLMHAHLQFGVPHSNMKRASLLAKTTYTIGGRSVSADIIQGSILGCRTYPPGQWLRLLISPKVKIRDGNEWQSYAIDRQQPLLRFALSSGSHSDPAVRIYTPRKLLEQLEAAKRDYICSTISFRKGHKILLPKVIESFAKESNTSSKQLLDMIKCSLPENFRATAQRYHLDKQLSNTIEWLPHNFTFRYVLPREVEGTLIGF